MKKHTLVNKPKFALILICLIVSVLHMEKGGGEMPSRYFDLTQSMAEEGTFQIDSYVGNTGDFSIHKGHYYSAAPPGLSFLGLIPYTPYKILYDLSGFKDSGIHEKLNKRIKQNYIDKGFDENNSFFDIDLVKFFVGNMIIMFFTSFLLTGMLGIVLYEALNLLYEDKKFNFILTLIALFGTLIFPYTIIYHAHVPSTFFAFYSFFLFLKSNYAKSSWKDLIIAGFSAGISIAMNYSLVPIILFLFIYFVSISKKKEIFKNLSLIGLGVIIPIILLMGYHYSCFGSPIKTAYDFLQPNLLETGNDEGYVGLTYPKIGPIFMLLFSPLRGLFFYMPFLIFSVIGFINLIKMNSLKIKMKELMLIAVIFIFVLFYTASYSKWHGDWSFGPRHMITTIPFLILLIPASINNIITKKVFYVLSYVSVFFMWLGSNFEILDISIKNPLFQKYIPQALSANFTLRWVKYTALLFDWDTRIAVLISLIILSLLLISLKIYIGIVLKVLNHENSNVPSTTK